ncbi:uncharacterized protein LOC144065368 isoform X2 [Stigmatopora argus]
MTCEKKCSSFQITSVTSEISTPIRSGPSTAGVILTAVRSKSAFRGPRGSSSQPSTPSSKRRHISLEPLGEGTGAPSRFRLVRLAGGGAGGRGRGGGDTYGRGRWTCTEFKEGRVADGVRNALSLESLESIGGAAPSASRHIGSVETGERPAGSSPSGSAAGPQNQSALRLSQSQPSSPPATLTSSGPDRSAAFSLPPDISAVAIDNKIEQAMDLAKSHLMLAVREEVELLREQIRELQDRNQQLEAENRDLRAQAHSDPELPHPAVSPSG